jgi:hypothetical protein
VTWLACLLEARVLYLVAGALDKARGVTGQVSGSYLRQGLYAELERLLTELLEREEHPETLIWLARAHAERAQYGPARDYNQRAVDLAGEADPATASKALHQFASIDLLEGAYPAAATRRISLGGGACCSGYCRAAGGRVAGGGLERPWRSTMPGSGCITSDGRGLGSLRVGSNSFAWRVPAYSTGSDQDGSPRASHTRRAAWRPVTSARFSVCWPDETAL